MVRHPWSRPAVVALVAFSAGVLTACTGRPEAAKDDAKDPKPAAKTHTPAAAKFTGPDGKVNAVATIGMITDIVKEVGGDRVAVEGLMGAGVDPHLFKPSAGNVKTLSGADIIFYNGLMLEGKMADVLVRMARNRPTVAVTEDLDPKSLREPDEFEGHYDPHVWFDVKLWIGAVQRVERALSELDPSHASEYQRRAAAYVAKLNELDAYAEAQIKTVPKERRVLITAHDAFGYFGKRYDIEVAGLQGISTATDFGTQDVKKLVDQIVERKIKAIFVESSVPKRSIEAVQTAVKARGHDVAIGGELFSDALGDPGTPEGTYIGMVRHNVDTIVKALK